MFGFAFDTQPISRPALRNTDSLAENSAVRTRRQKLIREEMINDERAEDSLASTS